MTVEDRLRATTEAVSASMRPVRPLDLPAASLSPAPARPGRARAVALRVLPPAGPPRAAGCRLPGGRFPGRRPSGWLIPLAAAAAVVILAAALVTARTLTGTPGAASSSGPAPVTARASLPKYFAMLSSTSVNSPSGVTVADTATGQALFTAKATPGDAKPGERLTFGSPSAAANGRTFALAVSPFGTSASAKAPTVAGWDVLRGNPDGTNWTLVRTFIPALPLGATLDTSALSPDASELAVLSHVPAEHPADEAQATLRIYSVATGHVLRAYNATGTNLEITGSPLGSVYPSITWLADGDGLNFAWASVKYHAKPGQPDTFTQQVRHLDLARPGANLLTISTLVTSITSPSETCGTLTPAADGKGALCGTQNVTYEPTSGVNRASATCHAAPPPLAFRYYSGLRGAYRVLYTLPPSQPVNGDCWFGSTAVLWASPSGSALIGTISQGRFPHLLNAVPVIGVAFRGQWTKLPAYRSFVGAF